MEEPPSYHSVQVLNDSDLEVDLVLVSRSVEACLHHVNAPPSDVRVLLTSEAKVAELNEKFRFVAGPTDVLTFPDDEPCSGDIAIAASYALRQSKLREVSFQDEIVLLAIHGALHLAGYDDEREPDRQKMIGEMYAVAETLGMNRGEDWGSLLHEVEEVVFVNLFRRRDLLRPFKAALDGVVFTFRTQRHMRFHLYVVVIVLLLGFLARLGLREMLVLLFTIALVLMAEMFNSAIEATVDLISPHYNPLAKFAKDISAGAVLVTTFIALVVGILLMFGEQRWEQIKLNLSGEGFSPPLYFRFVIGSFLLLIIIVVTKGLGKRGQVLQGGLVSGHATYGFFFAVSTAFLTENAVVAGIAILLASVIAQSRYEAKFHTISELTLGAFIGTVVSLILFGIIPK